MPMKRLLISLLFLIVVACGQVSEDNNTLNRWKAHAENITIVRDDYGVAHIYGKTDADAVFGLLYAQCEDDFKRVERNYTWAIGRLAEVEGEQALYSDLRARLFMTRNEAIDNFENSPQWLKDLCIAFADGINYFLHTHPEVKPALLTVFEPWMAMYFTEGSIGGDIERVSTEKIRAFYEDRSLKEILLNDESIIEEPKGSNGIAISGKLNKSGNALLLINPHTTFYFRGEYHMVSEEGLNAYGAVTWGQFFIYQGFNEHTGWMHTSTYTDVIDEFKETIEKKENQLFYRFGDELRPVQVDAVTLKYLDGDVLKEKTFPTYKTHHGPVTHKIDSQWVATALMWNPVKALQQSYIRTKQENLEGFNEMMRMFTNSSNNTVYADADGNIAYYHGNFIPRRDTTFNYTKPVDGSDPATDWEGLHPLEETISVINPPNGWVQNCNSTPFTSAAQYSPKRSDYPGYMSIDRENFRGIHAQRLLEDVKNITMDGLIDLANDPYLPAFEKVIPGLIDAYDQFKPNKIDYQAIEVLRNWDMKTSKASVGMTLAHFYGMNLLRNVNVPESLKGIERFNYYGTGLSSEKRVEIFAMVLEQLNNNFGTWKMPWGEVNRFQRLSGDIDLQFDDDQPSTPVGLTTGRWGALAAYGMRTEQKTRKIYGTRGNSFVAVVEFGDSLKAKSLLVGGQSGDPLSPHFDDQIELYTNGEFKDVAFYREDVEKRADESYHPGEREQ